MRARAAALSLWGWLVGGLIFSISIAVDGAATFTSPLGRTRFIRPQGSDFGVGEVLLEAGTRLTPGALLAAGGLYADLWYRQQAEQVLEETAEAAE